MVKKRVRGQNGIDPRPLFVSREKGSSLQFFSAVQVRWFCLRASLIFGLLLFSGFSLSIESLDAQEAEPTLRGKVVGVLDGDSLEVLVDRRPVQVRLAAIDAPEWDQTRGKDAKKALSTLAFGKQVVVKTKGKDNNERTLGLVEVEGRELNAAMLEQGWAWHFKRFDEDEKLAKLEAEARKAKRGLWADKNPTPPWEYRDKKKAAEPGKKSGTPAAGNGEYWLNTSSNTRHNSTCEHFKKSRNGRPCEKSEGKACGICGG